MHLSLPHNTQYFFFFKWMRCFHAFTGSGGKGPGVHCRRGKWWDRDDYFLFAWLPRSSHIYVSSFICLQRLNETWLWRLISTSPADMLTMCARLECHRETWMRWNHFHRAGGKMTDRSRQVLDEWSAGTKSIVGSPCKRLLSAFPGLPLAIDWFLKWLKNFWVSSITNINVQPASAIIWLLNLEFAFEISWWTFCFYSVGLGVTNFPLKLDFENAEIFIFFILVRAHFMVFTGNEPDVWKFSFVKNSYFLNGFGCCFEAREHLSYLLLPGRDIPVKRTRVIPGTVTLRASCIYFFLLIMETGQMEWSSDLINCLSCCYTLHNWEPLSPPSL